MIDGKTLMDKLYSLPEQFKYHMSCKEYARAKYCYDTAVTVSVFLELDNSYMRELFGERGERGVIIQKGLFPEEVVQKAYLECIKNNEVRENRKYTGVKRYEVDDLSGGCSVE